MVSLKIANGTATAPKPATAIKGKRTVSRSVNPPVSAKRELNADQWFALATMEVLAQLHAVTATAITDVRNNFDRPSVVDKELLKRALRMLAD